MSGGQEGEIQFRHSSLLSLTLTLRNPFRMLFYIWIKLDICAIVIEDCYKLKE